jgi:DNA polymerase alpha subunit A
MTLLTIQLRKEATADGPVQAVYLSYHQGFNVSDCRAALSDHLLLRLRSFEVTDPSPVFTDVAYDNELLLLKELWRVWNRLDPDIILGHELFSGILDVIIAKLERISFEGFYTAARIFGRPERFKIRQAKSALAKARIAFTGRLLVDTFGLCKEILKLDDFSLLSVASHYRGRPILSLAKGFLELVEHSTLLLEILKTMQVLPLTLQLSKVAGCLWSVSLRQARAERNEMLLMHTFYRKGYILPDRTSREKIDAEGKGFTGGKVLDPVVNFYDTYVVLVDFNSLYPSIIRHYNICFTTVQRELKLWRDAPEPVGNEERVPAEAEEDPAKEDTILFKPMNDIQVLPNQEPVLPSILSMLVSERKKVRADLKNARTEEQRLQLENKQLAFKLVANSIYGCLGFSFSRFYCRKMASLTTHFGRLLLSSSEQLIRNLNFEVIYGDTDSLMINTNARSAMEAVLVGLNIKKQVNDQFRQGDRRKEQVLEVELDGVFKKLLLVKKKKYAGLKLLNFSEIVKNPTGTDEELKLEIKGLDVVRRDWSKLTKDVSLVVLERLMEFGDLERVYAYLEKVNTAMNDFYREEVQTGEAAGLTVIKKCRSLQPKEETGDQEGDKTALKPGDKDDEVLPLRKNDFIIKKQLNKRPKEYGENENLPHLRVARWMMAHQGKSEDQLVNHHIPYLMVSKDPNGPEQPVAIDDYEGQPAPDQATYFPIDIDYYKVSQLIAPLNRILEPVDGHTEERLKLIFGLVSRTEPDNSGSTLDAKSSVSTAKGNLPFVYASTQVDYNHLYLPCDFCKGNCPAFKTHCLIDAGNAYEPGIFANRVFRMARLICFEYSSQVRKCPLCEFATNQVSGEDLACPSHPSKRLTHTVHPKTTSCKLLLFRNLCEDELKDKRAYAEPVEKMLRHIDKINHFEGGNFLGVFRRFDTSAIPTTLLKHLRLVLF